MWGRGARILTEINRLPRFLPALQKHFGEEIHALTGYFSAGRVSFIALILIFRRTRTRFRLGVCCTFQGSKRPKGLEVVAFMPEPARDFPQGLKPEIVRLLRHR